MQSGFAELAKNNPQALVGFDQSKLKALTNNSALIHQLPAEVQTTVLQSFVNSFHFVFFAAAPVTLAGFILALIDRKSTRLNSSH